MSSSRRKKIFRIAFVFGAVFVVLFVFRLLSGYYEITGHDGDADEGITYFKSLTNLKENYASEKISNFSISRAAAAALPADLPSGGTQKYEKTATVASKTEHFEDDEILIRKTTASFDGSTQYEQSQGRKGDRQLYLSIGVKPAVFDSFYRVIQTIGTLRSTEIIKVDKTNEYRQLIAKMTSLQNILSSLNDLKNKNGAIGDFILLHDKILEIQTQLQELGVNLGNYNTENEFCTLHFSLAERAAVKETGMFQRIKTALEWTIEFYAMAVFAMACVMLVAFLLLVIVDRLKIVTALQSRQKE